MYRKGKGVEKDGNMALEWYTKAADLNYASAMSRLGYMYLNGDGVAKNLEKAEYWYEKAYQAGDKDKAFQLGMLHMTTFSPSLSQSADGFKVQPDKAVQWFRIAADNEEEPLEQGFASFLLSGLYFNGVGGIKPDVKSSAQWMKKAEASFFNEIEMGKGGDALALGQSLGQLLAMIYFSDHGVPRNDVEAYKWLLISRQAAPLMPNIQNIPWGFSSAEEKRGQKLAEEWMAKRGKKLTVTKLSLPNNNRRSAGQGLGDLLGNILLGIGLGKALK